MQTNDVLKFLQSKIRILAGSNSYRPSDLPTLSTPLLKEIKGQLMLPLATQALTEGVDVNTLKTPVVLFIEALLTYRQELADKAKRKAALAAEMANLAEIRSLKERDSLLAQSLEEVDGKMATLAAEMAALD